MAMRTAHSLRASDADRDAVVDRLRQAAAEGRLEPDEFEQRVDAALHARTYGDLAGLLADIPGDRRVPVRRTDRRPNRPARPALIGAGLVVAVTAAFAVVAVVLMLVLVAAAAWMALVLIRLVWGAAGRRAVRAQHAHRTRPIG
jgi:Flp pilus assembly protein TadB